MRRKLAILLAFIIIVFLFLAPEAYPDAEEEFHQTYTVDAGTEVEVKNVNGEINISTWDENYVDVRALKRTKKDRDELDLVTIEVTLNEILEIETVHRKSEEDSFFKRMLGWSRSPKVSVDFTIKLPGSVILNEAVSVNGNVKVHGTRGDTIVKTTNGSIVVDNTDGFIEVKTTNGNISITGGAMVREAKATNGSIKVSLPENRIENTHISTVNGSVDLYLSPDINADIELKTVNGKISAGGFLMTVETISKREFIGTLGSGGETIFVKTVNGSISLHKE